MPEQIGATPKPNRRRRHLGRQWRDIPTNSVLGVDWTGTSVAVAELSHLRGQVGIGRRFFERWPAECSPLSDPEAAGAWLREQIAEHGLDHHAAIVSVPRRDTVLRLIEVPEVQGAELDALVQMQIQARSSVSIDDLHYDYLYHPATKPGGAQHVLIVTVPRATISVIRAVITAAGIDAKMYGIGELALGALSREPAAGLALHILANRSKFEVVLMQNGIPLSSQATLKPELDPDSVKALRDLVRRQIRGLPESVHFERVSQVKLFGPNAKALQAAIGNLFDAPVRCVDAPCDDSVRLFALHRSIFFSEKRLDFLHPRHETPQPVPLTSNRSFVLTGLAALLLLLFAAFTYQQTLAAEVRSLSNQKSRLEQQVERQQAFAGELGKLTSWGAGTEWTDVWEDVSKTLPAKQVAYLTKLHWIQRKPKDPPVVHLEGLARDADIVLTLHRELLAAEYDLLPQEIANSPDDEYPRHFRLHARPPQHQGSP